MQFVAKHLPDPFHLEGDQRISLREKIFREVVSNVLVHREYLDARPATFTIFQDRVEVVNGATPHGSGPIRPEHFTLYAKNPVLCRFFRQIGRAEELGSGVLNITRYLPFYAKGGQAQFLEGNPFTTILPLASVVAPGGEPPEKGGEKLTQNQGRILVLIKKDPSIPARELAHKVGITQRKIEQNLAKLKQQGRLRRIGPDKGGHWEIVKPR